MASHELMMQRCLELASHGAGLTSPNPLVGCVITLDNKVIGEGYHHRYGGPHAEVVAIGRVHDRDVLKTCTLYVNLEPCSHTGKTPPCSDLIIASGIPRVVIGCADSNPLVAGKGIKRLRDAGVEVITGILEKESRFLNRHFFTYHEARRPYIILKWAQTHDGYIDINRDAASPVGINWITDPKLRMLVHRWRSESDAILAGAGTIRNDDPQLTTREWPGKNPLRIVLDREGSLEPGYRIFDGTAYTWLFTGVHSSIEAENLRVFSCQDPQTMLEQLMHELFNHHKLTLLVEGGSLVLESFVAAGLWDEFRVFTGKGTFGEGLKAPELPGAVTYNYLIGSDLLQIGYNRKQTEG